MLKKILAALGIGLAASQPATPAEPYQPYAEPHVNFLYNLLFCDDLGLYRNADNAGRTGPWPVLLAGQVDEAALRRIAEDEANEARVRALAYNRLRAAGKKVPARKLLGVIVEVPFPQGLDVLAAFADGGVRYLNQSGKVAIFDGRGHPLEGAAMDLMSASRPIVERIGPWDKARLPPPKPGNVRITLLVSDGLYFGEGSFDALQKDTMAGPVLAQAALLVKRTVDLTVK